MMKKLRNFIFSMRFALILLLLLVLACVAGSVIPQGYTMSYYTQSYSQQLAGAVLLFGLDDVFHSVWFIVLVLILCANLLGCNVLRFPALLRRFRSGFTPEHALAGWDGKALVQTHEPEALFQKNGFRRVKTIQTEESRELRYSVRNRAGIWGAWLCHFGMLIVILGFGLGQITEEEYTVYGVPGETKAVEGTDYEVTIDDFVVALRDDDTVEQYTATITVTDTQTGESGGGQTSVNSPLSLFGMRFYQNSTGWAATVQIWKDEELIQEDLLCAGEYTLIEDIGSVAVMFSAFYPDYVEDVDGSPGTASSRLNNPAYLYQLYYHNEVIGMNVLTGDEVITLDDYTIVFTDPQQYTLLQIKRDSFAWLTAIEGLLVALALILAFYLRTEELWALENEDGSWSVGGRSVKGGEEFRERIRGSAETAEELEEKNDV